MSESGPPDPTPSPRPSAWARSPEGFLEVETIVAIATAAGAGAIGIVRLSGPAAIRLALEGFRMLRQGALRPDESYTLLYGHVVAPQTEEVLDEALLAVMRGPRSYTREDVAELHCHGGVAAQRAVLRLMVRLGARLAEPGEFTRRAFLNGRIDLAQAESVAAIVAARSSSALRASVRHLDGGLSEKLRALRGDLVGFLARVEASVDFSDEDVDEVDWGALRNGLDRVRLQLRLLADTAFLGRVLEQGLRTAIVGRPNAGKSSLLNALLMRERAIVSEIPGTTRDTIEELIEIGGIPIQLVDTAGLSAGGDRLERLGVERSLSVIEQADLVLMVVDLAVNRDDKEQALIWDLDPRRLIVVGNKTDLFQGEPVLLAEAEAGLAGLCGGGKGVQTAGPSGIEWCLVSARTGDGLDGLREMIREAATGRAAVDLQEPVLVNERQRVLVEDAMVRTTAALNGIASGLGEELICEDVRGAAQALGRITGEDVTADLLDEIFSRFCIGK